MQRRRGRATKTSFENWSTWWYYNKEGFLNLKTRLYQPRVVSESAAFFFGRRTKMVVSDTARPTRALARQHVVPALRAALRADSAEVRDSACVALGKVGGVREVPVLKLMICDRVRSVREGAVIGLGLLQVPEAIPVLMAILQAGSEGRALTGRKPGHRLRAFAAAGLGLTGDDSEGRVQRALIRFSGKSGEHRDVAVNSVIGLGLLRGNRVGMDPVIAHLKKLALSLRVVDAWVRAHAVIALGRQHERNGFKADDDTIRLLCRLAARDRVRHVRRSAVIALGRVIRRPESHPDAVRQLTDMLVRDPERQTRHFTAIALGRIGGDRAHQALRHVVLMNRNQLRIFGGLGLGILCSRGRQALGDSDGNRESVDLADRGTAHRDSALPALRRAFKETRNPDHRGGLAIALGIARDHEAGALLMDAMKRTSDEALRGHIAVALGMIKHTAAVDFLIDILKNTRNRPGLQRCVAVGLGLMGHRDIVVPLVVSLRDARSMFVLGSITRALGYVGDRTAIRPLAILVQNPRAADLNRGFACVALGRIADDGPLPALSELAAGHNYLATTESLNELLDIL